MTNMIGRALEDVSRATGSVSHFYRSLQIGSNVGQCRINNGDFHGDFREMINNLQVLRRVSGNQS